MKKNVLPGLPGHIGPMTATERRLGRYIRDGQGHPSPLTKQFTEAVEKQFESLSADVKKALEEAEVAKAIVFDIEQKMARRGGGGSAPPATWGGQFTDGKSAELSRVASERGRTSMEIKATITSATTAAEGSAGDLIIPQREQVVGMPKRRLTIRSLLNTMPTSAGSVEYPVQVTRPGGAAVVAEGAEKPQSDMQFDLKTIPIRTIAHWVKASRQILEDAPQLAAMIDSELIYGLALIEEAELLYGDGTGQHLMGMVPQATAYASPAGLDADNMLDDLGLAILQCSLTDNEPDGIIIHPSDWWRLRLMKDSEGRYLFGAPGAVVQPSVFGLPIIATKAMTADKFLVGAFGQQTLYDRWLARVEVGFVNDDFTRNLVTVLGEERIGFAAKRPEALIYGDFGNV